jgi:hypothetical protein
MPESANRAHTSGSRAHSLPEGRVAMGLPSVTHLPVQVPVALQGVHVGPDPDPVRGMVHLRHLGPHLVLHLAVVVVGVGVGPCGAVLGC